jgi:hypothetical protein
VVPIATEEHVADVTVANSQVSDESDEIQYSLFSCTKGSLTSNMGARQENGWPSVLEGGSGLIVQLHQRRLSSVLRSRTVGSPASHMRQ